MIHRVLQRQAIRLNRLCWSVFRKGVLAWAASGLLLEPAYADRPATYWISPSGDFFDPGNWNLGSPGTALDAKIDNGGVALINSVAFQTIPYVYLGSAQYTTGTLQVMAGGEASFTTMVVGALNATGTLNIMSGGKLTSFGGPIGSDYLGVGIATVDGPGSLWKVTGSEMAIGGNGTGTVRLQNGGSVTVANGSGKIQLANHPVSEGNLFIGTGGVPGVLSANEIYNGEGRATVVFNHTSPSLTFASKFTGLKTVNGYLNIRQEGPGTTILTAAESNLAGSVTVAAGTLIVIGKIMGSVRDVVIDDQVFQEKTVGVTEVLANGTLGGTGFIEGNTTIRGTLSPGMSAGILTFGGNLSLESSSTVRIELGGQVRGTQFDGVDVDGTLSYGGTLEIVLLNGFVPNEGDAFDLFEEFNSYSGTFSNIAFTGGGFSGIFNPQTGVLTVVPEPGVGSVVALVMGGLAMKRRRQSLPGSVKSGQS